MIHVTSFYEMDAEQIEVLTREKGTGTHPYILKITTKAGHTFSAAYNSEAQREGEIRRIVAEIARAKQSDQLTTTDIRWAVAVEIDKLRPYLRRIEKILKETKTEEKA